LCAEGSPTAISASPVSDKLFKEREDETSQLNRLDGLTFLFAYFPISAVLLGFAFIFSVDHKSIGAKLLLNFLLQLRF